MNNDNDNDERCSIRSWKNLDNNDATHQVETLVLSKLFYLTPQIHLFLKKLTKTKNLFEDCYKTSAVL